MLLANGDGGAVAIRAGEQVLANEAFDMAGVAWHLLVPYLVVRSIDPVLGVTTHVAKYNLVLIDSRYEIRAVEAPSLIHILLTVENDGMLAGVLEDLSLDLASRGSKSLILRWHVAGVARQVLLIVVTWRCEFRHILNYQIK